MALVPPATKVAAESTVKTLASVLAKATVNDDPASAAARVKVTVLLSPTFTAIPTPAFTVTVRLVTVTTALAAG